MDESFRRLDEDRLLLGAYEETADGEDRMTVYEIVFDDNGWSVMESDKPLWEN